MIKRYTDKGIIIIIIIIVIIIIIIIRVLKSHHHQQQKTTNKRTKKPIKIGFSMDLWPIFRKNFELTGLKSYYCSHLRQSFQ